MSARLRLAQILRQSLVSQIDFRHLAYIAVLHAAEQFCHPAWHTLPASNEPFCAKHAIRINCAAKGVDSNDMLSRVVGILVPVCRGYLVPRVIECAHGLEKPHFERPSLCDPSLFGPSVQDLLDLLPSAVQLHKICHTVGFSRLTCARFALFCLARLPQAKIKPPNFFIFPFGPARDKSCATQANDVSSASGAGFTQR